MKMPVVASATFRWNWALPMADLTRRRQPLCLWQPYQPPDGIWPHLWLSGLERGDHCACGSLSNLQMELGITCV
jgi:hypothetical protein